MFNVRAAVEADLPLILNSWLKRYRSAIHPRLVTDRVYYESQHAVIRKIFDNPALKVVVACDPEDTNHVYGYAVAEDLAPGWVMIHWVYTKGAFRKFGVAKHLLQTVIGDATRVQYSHKTALVQYLDKQNQATFVPQFVWALL